MTANEEIPTRRCAASCRPVGLTPGAALLASLALSLTLSASPASAGIGRPWDATMRAFMGYSDNVGLASDSEGGGTGSGNGGVLASGSYRIYEDPRWSLGGRGSLSILGNMSRKASSFDTLSVGLGLFAGRRLELLDRPARASVSYDFGQDLVEFYDFERRHSIAIGLDSRRGKGLRLGSFYRVAVSDFGSDFGNRGRRDRDSVRNTVGISSRYALNGGRESISGSYAFSANSASGRNFDFFAHTLSANASTARAFPLMVSLDLSYTRQDYPNFTASPKRAMDIVTPRLRLDLPLSRHFAADFFVAYTMYGSNRDDFESDVVQTGLGLNYRF